MHTYGKYVYLHVKDIFIHVHIHIYVYIYRHVHTCVPLTCALPSQISTEPSSITVTDPAR